MAVPRTSLLLSTLAALAYAAPVYPPGFSEKIVAQALTSPTAMAFAPDGRLFIAQQEGAVAVVRNDQLLPQPMMTLRTESGKERGLLGLTVDPDFADNHYVYVFYTHPSPSPHNRLSRFTEAGNLVDTAKETVLVDFPTFASAGVGLPSYHMGGGLRFGGDGKLYLGLGEAQKPPLSQDLSSVFGKILRFNADGSIPEDGPFFATGTGLGKAIWAYGLRNPFTIAVQPKTGLVFANDVGNNTWEEVDKVEKGGNFGWDLSEGPTTDARYVAPLNTYKHTEGCAIMGGGFVVDNSERFAAYRGRYFFTDFCQGWIHHMDPQSGKQENFAIGLVFPTGLEFSPQGDLYYVLRGHRTGAIQKGAGKAVKVFNPRFTGVTPVRAARRDITRGWVVNLAHAGEGSRLAVPAGMSALDLYDNQGRLVWQGRAPSGGMDLALPGNLPMGPWQYRWAPAK